MVNKKVLLFIVLVLSLNLIYASDYKVGYVYKSKVDEKIVRLFSELRLEVDLIKESELSNLSDYKIVFLGDEDFKNNIEINKYPSVIMNHYLPKKVGIVGDVGISKLASNQPLFVNFGGKLLKVYKEALDNKRNSLFYYYLYKDYSAPSLEKYVATYSTSSGSDFGTVVALGSKGDRLLNGAVLEENICFFGITGTNYWTKDAENLFKDCVRHVFDYTRIPSEVIVCSKDSDCGKNGVVGLPFCSNKSVFVSFVVFKCVNPGLSTSYCKNESNLHLLEKCFDGCLDGKCKAIGCFKDSDCEDGNLTTDDFCQNPGTINSQCVHRIYTNITQNTTQVKLVSFVATPGVNFVVLNFSAENSSIVKGFLLGKNQNDLFFVSSNSYVFDNLSENTTYVFSVRAVDFNDHSSEEMNLSITTLVSDVPKNEGSGGAGTSVSVVGGGGGGSRIPISGSFSYCSTVWECTQWSQCANGTQTRVCSFPEEKCKPEVDKPIEEQACVEKIEGFKETSESFFQEEPSSGSENPKNFITGAAVLDAFRGKNALIGILLLVILGAIVYFGYKKLGFYKKKKNKIK